MQVELSGSQTTIDAKDLGPLLGLAPENVLAHMRSGAITSIAEEGIGEDSGRTRLTFWYGNIRLRLICDESGKVLKTTRTVTKQYAQ